MKKVLTCILIGAMLMLIGCASEVQDEVPVKDLEEFAEQLFEYKYEYLTAIQLDQDKGPVIINEMHKAGKIADKLTKVKMYKLANVYHNIHAAAKQFDEYLATDNDRYFTKGVMYYNDAEVEYKNYKGDE